MLCCSGTWAHTAECSQAQPAWHKQWERAQSGNRAMGVPHVCSLFMVQTHTVWSLRQCRLWSPRNSNILLPKETLFCSNKGRCALWWHQKALSLQALRCIVTAKGSLFSPQGLSFAKVLHKWHSICKTLPQVAYLTSNSRWFIVHAVNKVILGFQVGHGLVIQEAAAFTVEMPVFCLRYPSAFSVILPPLLLLLQCLEVSIRTRYNQLTNFPELQSIGIPHHSHTGG